MRHSNLSDAQRRDAFPFIRRTRLLGSVDECVRKYICFPIQTQKPTVNWHFDNYKGGHMVPKQGLWLAIQGVRIHL